MQLAVLAVQVRSLQVRQLEGLLGLLQGVPPFAGLGREKLVSLAIFLRPFTAPKDQVIVRQGQVVDTLYLIKQGQQPCQQSCQQHQHCESNKAFHL